MRKLQTAFALSASLLCMMNASAKQPNIVFVFADDISAREFPTFGSSQWTNLKGQSSSDTAFRASTPVIDRLAREGCWFTTCWGATVSSPCRAQLMTGRFAYQTKWWHNGDTGTYKNAQGKQESWPLYESSPLQLGIIAQKAGYATYWAEKTQMPHEYRADKYGYDEMCVTPGSPSTIGEHTTTDFRMVSTTGKYNGIQRVVDSGRTIDTYTQISYYWKPGVMLVNHPSQKEKNKGELSLDLPTINDFGPDIAQDYIFDFIDRKHKEDKPVFIYHTTHLGHGAYNFLNPDCQSQYPETPKIEWKNGKYVRSEPAVTGDKGVYDVSSLSPEGIHNHINYIDYVVWKYLEKFRELGEEDNTIFIISADNGTSKYGKGSVLKQRGVHIPFIIYSPSKALKMTKQGKQEQLMSITDVLPTLAEFMGVEIPADYKIDGKSLMPYLTTNTKNHRDFTYSYRSGMQLIRGKYVMKDGFGDWYDVSREAADYDNYPLIEDWSSVSEAHRREKAKLMEQLKEYDLYLTERNGPGGTSKPSGKALALPKKKPTVKAGAAKNKKKAI